LTSTSHGSNKFVCSQPCHGLVIWGHARLGLVRFHGIQSNRNNRCVKKIMIVSGTALGVPLNNGGKPHLNPATKPKYVKPNHAGA
jgi:hypothetical protein